jgi:SET domain-containing protein
MDSREKDTSGTTSSGNAGEMVSYNPNLYELADDDLFDYQNSGTFLDEELESMLTTDREKLKKGDIKNDITSVS